MNLKKLITVASLILAVGAFAPAIFAQVGGVTRVTGGSNVVPESPSNGQPGTEMPANLRCKSSAFLPVISIILGVVI
jgi:hypothetical protein